MYCEQMLGIIVNTAAPFYCNCIMFLHTLWILKKNGAVANAFVNLISQFLKIYVFFSHKRQRFKSIAHSEGSANEKPKKPQVQYSNSSPRTPTSQPLGMKPALEQSVPALAALQAQPTLSSQAHANIHLPQPNNSVPSRLHQCTRSQRSLLILLNTPLLVEQVAERAGEQLEEGHLSSLCRLIEV